MTMPKGWKPLADIARREAEEKEYTAKRLIEPQQETINKRIS